MIHVAVLSGKIDHDVLVCDGAMGTMLYANGVFFDRSFDGLNVSQPDLVAEIREGNVRAGADVLEKDCKASAKRVRKAAKRVVAKAKMNTLGGGIELGHEGLRSRRRR